MSASESKSSRKPVDAAKKLTDRLLVYTSFRPEQYEGFVEAFKRMLGEFGEARVAEGLTKAIDNHAEFPPSPAFIRQHIPRDVAQRPTCTKCSDTEGFLPIMVRNKITGQVEKGVKFCEHTL